MNLFQHQTRRLFVFLSRFCQARYCIVRHCGFLVGYGHSSGDASAAPQTIEQAVRLLKAPRYLRATRLGFIDSFCVW